MKRRSNKKQTAGRFDEFKDFVAWARGQGAQAVKIGDVEVIFKGQRETQIGFNAPADPHGWDYE